MSHNLLIKRYILLAINILVWNTYHSLVDPETICQPYTYLSKTQQNQLMNTPYIQWLIATHQEHHNHTNNRNFNIVFPGADYLFGTYNQNNTN